MDEHVKYSRRERQIMDVVFARGRASVTDVLAEMPDPPTRTAVRTMLRILEGKGHLAHDKRGREFIYRPTTPRNRAARSALRRVLDVFFDGSFEKAAATHLLDPGSDLSEEELARVAALIRDIREKKRRAE